MTQEQLLTGCVPAILNAEELGDKSSGKNISYFSPDRDFTMKLTFCRGGVERGRAGLLVGKIREIRKSGKCPTNG